MVQDITPPTAAIDASPTSGLAIPVSWEGSDPSTGSGQAGSGVRGYEVEYKEEGGAWTEWLTETATTQAILIGTVGMTYTFRIKATDNVDNTTASWVESDEVVVYGVRKYCAFGGRKVAMLQGDVVRMRISMATILGPRP